MATDGERREEILETAASLFASSGIRTSLKEIGDACGILPGSLYHHFDSKDAIVVELVQRYRDELDQVAKDALDSLHEPGPTAVEERVTQLGEAIARCAVRNRAALLLTLYEPPTTASDVLVELARQAPTAITAAMTDVLEAGHHDRRGARRHRSPDPRRADLSEHAPHRCRRLPPTPGLPPAPDDEVPGVPARHRQARSGRHHARPVAGHAGRAAR